MTNIMNRDTMLKEMNHMNNVYNIEATDRFMKMSQQTA